MGHLIGRRSDRSRGLGWALNSDQTVFAQFCDEPDNVALDTEGNVCTQIRLGHQAPGIARLRDGGQQVILFEAEEPAGNLGGVRHGAAAVLRPERITQRPGSEHVLLGSLVECASAYQKQIQRFRERVSN